MNEEPITVTYSLAEILSRLDQKIDRLDQKIDQLDQKIDGVEARLETKIDGVEARLETKIDGVEDKLETKLNQQSEEIASIKGILQGQQPSVQKIPDLAEKVGELKNWRQFVIITLTATISGLIGWLIRGGNFKP